MKLSKQIIGFDTKALKLLHGYHWPYNYVQLKRVLTELATMTSSPYIDTETTTEILKKEILQEHAPATQNLIPVEICTPGKTVVNLEQSLSDITKEIIQQVLDNCDGNQSKAARQLDISRTTLWRYMR